jgi:hypothetical protein
MASESASGVGGFRSARNSSGRVLIREVEARRVSPVESFQRRQVEHE